MLPDASLCHPMFFTLMGTIWAQKALNNYVLPLLYFRNIPCIEHLEGACVFQL